MSVVLNEALLQKAAGWDVVKRARAYLELGQVLSSYWQPPLLRGVVQNDGVSFRASMVIKNEIDIENLCTCRDAREWGKICAHGVAVALHWIEAQKPKAAEAGRTTAGGASVPASRLVNSVAPPRKASSLQRAATGEPAELFLILPPNFEQAIARGKVMVVFEAKWGGGRCPLNALPKGRAFAFSAQDNAVIESIEALADGETPALLQLDAKNFAALLPLLEEHENITIGKASSVTVTRTPFQLPLRVTLEANGEIVFTLKEKVGAFAFVGDWVWHKQTLQPLGLPPGTQSVLQSPVRVPRSQLPLFLSQHWPQLQAAGGVEANFKLEDFTLEPQAPRFVLSLRGGMPVGLE